MNKPPLPKGMRWMTAEEIEARASREYKSKSEKSIWKWIICRVDITGEWDKSGWAGTLTGHYYCTNKPKGYWLTH